MTNSKTLLEASSDPRYSLLSECTIGIIFFGTPHRSDVSKSSQIFSKIIKSSGFSRGLIEIAEMDTKAIDITQSNFHRMLREKGQKGPAIVCLYEAMPSLPYGMVVPPNDTGLQIQS